MDIEQLIKQAKKAIMEKGKYAPVIFVETTNGIYLLPPHKSSWNSEHEEIKSSGFYICGRSLAKSQHERPEDVVHLIMINEVWFRIPDQSEVQNEDINRPSLHKDRREALLFLEMKPENGRETFYSSRIYEIIRYKNDLIDLVPLHFSGDDGVSIQSRFFPSFLAGMRHPDMDDRTMTQNIDSFIKTGTWPQ